MSTRIRYLCLLDFSAIKSKGAGKALQVLVQSLFLHEHVHLSVRPADGEAGSASGLRISYLNINACFYLEPFGAK